MKIQDITMGQWVDEKERSVSDRLYAKRLQLGISREELAEAIDIEEAELASYEEGREAIPASIFFLIAVALEQNPITFLEQDSESEVYADSESAKSRLRMC